MIDFHTHTFLSDGGLGPAEHIRQAEVAGYRVLGISDHADLATLDWLVPMAVRAAETENRLERLHVVAGVELTHVRPEHLAEAARRARELGASLVIAHGQSPVEPVEAGTNRSAVEAGVDILAHPGLIEPADAALAAERGVLLEVTAKAGHSLANGHVVAVARQTGAKLIFSSDAHDHTQMPSRQFAEAVLRGAGMTDDEIALAWANAEQLAERVRAGKPE